MTRIRLGEDDIKLITLFESMTKAKVKDFISEGGDYCFIVKSGDMGLAIGKGGASIAKVRKVVGRNIMVFEHDDDPEAFIKNMFHPVEVHGVSVAKTSGNTAAVVEVAREDRSRAIGPGGAKIRMIKAALKRQAGVDELNLRAV